MDRPIKFRAWFPKLNEMHYDDQVSIGDQPIEVITEDRVLMQFTGLKDKNDVEIYEGDIVKANYYAFSEGKTDKVKGEVIYDTEQFIGYRIGGTRMSACSNFEVIGNIYENPELMK